MKARFTEIPKELTTYVDGSIVYYQIALNPQKVEENDPETDQIRTEYECDFNSFFAPDYVLNPADVEADPASYLGYTPEEVSDSEQRLRDIETAITELGTIIGG